MSTPERPPPISQQLGRASRRWWHRNGDTVRRVSRPARQGWAGLVGLLWIVAYTWVGLMIAVGARNLTGATGPLALIAGVGGGLAMGWWQARHRMARHLHGRGPQMRWFGAALAAWIAVVGLALAADLGVLPGLG